MARRSPSPRDGRSVRDAGYIIAMGGLLMLPLLAFTGLAVDLGSWYARAAEIQRVTDAASLGGVALLPLSEQQAVDRSIEIARQNGFIDGQDGIEVEAHPVGIDQMQVIITDTQVPQYFTRLFRDEVTVSRSSIAEYIPPVRMGSPRNFLGTGQLSGVLPSGAVPENFFLSINSPCAYLEDGDLLASVNMGFAGDSNACTPSRGHPNPDYEPRGYIYGVRVDEGYEGGPIDIQVYDAAYCPTGSGAIDLRLTRGTDAWGNLIEPHDEFSTRFTVRNPAPNPYNGSIRTTVEATPANCSFYRGQWRTIDTISAPEEGDIYAIQVQTHSPINNSRGSANNFAIRARTGGSWQACSADQHEADPTIPKDPQNCPNVFAFEHLSIFADVDGSSAEFYLASIGPEHSGKELIIELFDPGEGGDRIRLLDPTGNFARFDRSVRQRFPRGPVTAVEATPADGWGVATNQTSININRVGPAPGDNRLTDERCRTSPTGGANDRRCIYNERSLRLRVDLPDNIATAYGGLTWWKVRYDFRTGVDVTDRTTWSVSVRGDPVRLID